jgi:hypothetical protein
VDRVKDNSNLDAIITWIFLKKMCSPIVKTPAYLLGIVNASGKKIKNPSTEEEKIAYTTLDEIIYWIKRNLGGKISVLNQFLYTITSGNSFYNKLLAVGNVETRAEIIRIKKDISRLSESLGYTTEGLLKMMIADEVEILNESKVKD